MTSTQSSPVRTTVPPSSVSEAPPEARCLGHPGIGLRRRSQPRSSTSRRPRMYRLELRRVGAHQLGVALRLSACRLRHAPIRTASGALPVMTGAALLGASLVPAVVAARSTNSHGAAEAVAWFAASVVAVPACLLLAWGSRLDDSRHRAHNRLLRLAGATDAQTHLFAAVHAALAAVAGSVAGSLAVTASRGALAATLRGSDPFRRLMVAGHGWLGCDAAVSAAVAVFAGVVAAAVSTMASRRGSTNRRPRHPRAARYPAGLMLLMCGLAAEIVLPERPAAAARALGAFTPYGTARLVAMLVTVLGTALTLPFVVTRLGAAAERRRGGATGLLVGRGMAVSAARVSLVLAPTLVLVTGAAGLAVLRLCHADSAAVIGVPVPDNTAYGAVALGDVTALLATLVGLVTEAWEQVRYDRRALMMAYAAGASRSLLRRVAVTRLAVPSLVAIPLALGAGSLAVAPGAALAEPGRASRVPHLASGWPPGVTALFASLGAVVLLLAVVPSLVAVVTSRHLSRDNAALRYE